MSSAPRPVAGWTTVLRSLGLTVAISFVSPAGAASPPAWAAPKPRIDLTDPVQLQARRPLLIAHRGGVVTPAIPECSLAAIREAARWGYDLVELDVRESKDGVPMVFHDRDLAAACDRDTTIAQLTAAEAQTIRYRKNQETISRLDEALGLCVQLKLGVMIDFKDTPRRDFVKRVAALVRKHGLERSAMTISGAPVVREELGPVALVPVNAEELRQIEAREAPALRGKYWFGIPSWIKLETIPKLRQAGALVIPAINTFRYENDPDRAQARREVRQLRALDVEGFQIDAMYQDFFDRPPVPGL